MSKNHNQLGGITPTSSQHAAAIERAAENVALRSGAGCGKTLVLAMRFTELLMNCGKDKNPLDKFVALTFTEKAAGEMLQRVRRMLTNMLQGAGSDDAHRIRRWIDDLPEANISTIHGFCASLLRKFAVEAGIDPSFAICADELAVGRMRTDAADEAMLRAVENRRDDVAELLTALTYDRATDLVKQLLEHRTEWDPDEYADPHRILGNWERRVEQARRAAWDELDNRDDLREEMDATCSVPCQNEEDKLYQHLRRQAGVVKDILTERQNRTAETFASLNAKPGNIGSAKAWGSKEQVKDLRRRLNKLVAAVGEYTIYAESPGELDRQSADMLATLTRLAVEADEIYAKTKRANGMLDFTDLQYHTNRLLRDNPVVRKALLKSFDQFLIDEAQDTDPFQISLLRTLVTGDSRAEEIPKGRLFLVGDDKQSIYRFRGVRVEVFRQLCRQLGDRARQDLETSFRTHPKGIEFINYLFSRLMDDDYTPIKPKRGETPPEPSTEIILAGPEEGEIENASHASNLQAAATAERIAEMIRDRQKLVWSDDEKCWRAVRPGDVAILFARMTNSPQYERELAAREIPYYVVAGSGFFRQQEVYDVLNALSTVDNPGDDIAFFGVLRSGMFGLNDEALMSISQNVSKPYLPSLIDMLNGTEQEQKCITIPQLEDYQSQTLTFAVELLSRLHQLKDTLGAGRVVDELLEATAYEGVLLAQFQGAQKVGNVRRVGELARQASASGLTLAEFISQMNEQVVDQSRYEQAPVTGEAEDVVRLMTIHKAKGLEFPVVIIPDLNAGRQKVNDQLLNRPDWGLTYRHKAEDNDDSSENDRSDLPLTYRLSALAEQEDMQKEDTRRLYVAATRHRDHLVFIGADWRTQEDEFRSGGSYLNQLDEVLDISTSADACAGKIRCGENGCEVSLRKMPAAVSQGASRRKSHGDKLIKTSGSGGELGQLILKAAPDDVQPPPLLGAIPDAGPARLSATAIGDFAYCSMLYRWRYELRVPTVLIPAGGEESGAAGSRVIGDAAAIGTILHQCMSLIDFDNPADAWKLLEKARRTLPAEQFASADPDELAEQLQSILENFKSHPLWRRITNATERYAESDFIMPLGTTTVTGRMDLLAREADGSYFVVDYKSDKISSKHLEKHALKYRTQMMTYALAASRLTDSKSSMPSALLYFLRPAEQYEFEINRQSLDETEKELREIIERLKECPREGDFHTGDCPACKSGRDDFCPYKLICR